MFYSMRWEREQAMKLLPNNCYVPLATLLACLMAMTCGCGNNSGLVPVSGKVVFESRDLPKVCRLTFLPVGGQPAGQVRPGSATMESDGDYTLTEFRGIKGLYPGEYKVTVAYYDLKPGGNKDVEADWKEVIYDLPEKLVVDADAGRVDFDVVVP